MSVERVAVVGGGVMGNGIAQVVATSGLQVTLVDVEVVRFLTGCEHSGVELLHCRRYIREWMSREHANERERL